MDTGFNQQERASLAQRIVDDEIDLLQLWQTIWRRKWSIITLTLVVMMLAALVVLSVTPIYKGVSTLLIEQKAAKAVSIEDIYGLDGGSNEYLQTQFELLKSRELAERVVRELNLTTHPELDPRQQPEPLIDISGMLKSFDIRKWLPIATPADFEASDELTEAQIFDRVVLAFMERTTISPVMKTQLVKVEVEMADAALAAQAANALANAYIESQLEAKLDMTQTATNWMNERLSTLKSKLQESERNLQAFREAENLVDLEGVTTVAGGELSQTGDRLIDARRSRAEAESQYRQVASMKSAGWERLATVPAVLSNPLVQQFKAEEGRARSKVQELSRRYGPKHPKMISANTELSAASTNLRSQVDQVVASIEREYQLATANERSLQGSFNRNKEQIQDIKRKEFKLRELQREVDSNRSLYDTFMTRLKETSATSDFE
ncbi:MAG: GumC family protein, partial [Oceanospirillales bacterium]|nr:GumC family protein [Oceanospirillales bacterium]